MKSSAIGAGEKYYSVVRPEPKNETSIPTENQQKTLFRADALQSASFDSYYHEDYQTRGGPSWPGCIGLVMRFEVRTLSSMTSGNTSGAPD